MRHTAFCKPPAQRMKWLNFSIDCCHRHTARHTSDQHSSALDALAISVFANSFRQDEGATAQSTFATTPTASDPYSCQCGFGNHLASESIPGEQLNGSSFVSIRQALQHVWMYRIRSSVAHRELSRSNLNDNLCPRLESYFGSSNKRVEYNPSQQAWNPFPLPEASPSSSINYELPELGPIGSNFDIDSGSGWEIVHKLAGNLHTYLQPHTPFDVVAWHSNYSLFKYAVENFINMANVECDQADPTIYCEHLSPIFWFLPPNGYPYAILYGTYGGSSHVLEPGGLSCETSNMPYGETYGTWKTATTQDLVPTRVCDDTLAFVSHISVPLLLTEWELQSPALHPNDPNKLAEFKGRFLDHLNEVNAELSREGLPILGASEWLLDVSLLDLVASLMFFYLICHLAKHVPVINESAKYRYRKPHRLFSGLLPHCMRLFSVRDCTINIQINNGTLAMQYHLRIRCVHDLSNAHIKLPVLQRIVFNMLTIHSSSLLNRIVPSLLWGDIANSFHSRPAKRLVALSIIIKREFSTTFIGFEECFERKFCFPSSALLHLLRTQGKLNAFSISLRLLDISEYVALSLWIQEIQPRLWPIAQVDPLDNRGIIHHRKNLHLFSSAPTSQSAASIMLLKQLAVNLRKPKRNPADAKISVVSFQLGANKRGFHVLNELEAVLITLINPLTLYYNLEELTQNTKYSTPNLHSLPPSLTQLSNPKSNIWTLQLQCQCTCIVTTGFVGHGWPHYFYGRSQVVNIMWRWRIVEETIRNCLEERKEKMWTLMSFHTRSIIKCWRYIFPESQVEAIERFCHNLTSAPRIQLMLPRLGSGNNRILPASRKYSPMVIYNEPIGGFQ
ncbi:RmlC-like cupin [Lindgomyces ingoldianus]|uniref:RmlC-like cupin n=1 Tax=Lindgomyces ingoldianus TaxID=673940 RepID=A0ACB6QWP5_9PLEO|nr:RmlC-like cupin [Lindgomyces ingoldianus]KAF2471438.1 RmlC-like cupin [Lindgomyces ingoldianus]